MFRVKKTINGKIMSAILLPIISLSIIFSFMLFLASDYVITNHLVPAFEEGLTMKMHQFNDLFDAEMVNEAKTDRQAYEDMLAKANDFQKSFDLENVYIMSKVDGEEVILFLGNSDDYLTPLAFTEDQAKALTTTGMVMSDFYKDDYGTHKSVFLQIEGTDSVLGLDEDADFIKDLERNLMLICIGLSIFFVVTSYLISRFISGKISKPINKLANFTELVANGDLTQDISIESDDETGRLAASFNRMQQQLKNTLQHVTSTSDHVVSASNDLSQSIGQVTEVINQISTTIQEVAANSETVTSGAVQNQAAIQEISEGVLDISKSTVNVTDETLEASTEAEQGNTVIQEAVKGIEAINLSAKSSMQVTQQMNQRSNEVGNITQMITNISDQINLLALNAAIEAARAGEYGRGFAVVADEIRHLAEQSATSASEISKLISEMQTDSNESVLAIAKVVEEIDKETVAIRQAGDTFQKISLLINNITGKMQSVAATVQQISAGSEQVLTTTNMTVQSLEETSDYTQNVAASIEEQSASMEEMLSTANQLLEMAEHLKGQISHFKTE
ncbi:methyl-accepting chemotaxis protein [Bacillus sp. REN10]|uniref:methyl-accepting chemotaxis protein n=1 Tax=Bacillus sp. REN10 TaxID=2782541 RepID=UPI00193AFB0C|nr:methyl-accepting chemotaxis protein [Bacillus sp. REN10]